MTTRLPVSLAPDPVIEAYKKDVDRTLLRENLDLSPEGRLRKLQDFVTFAASGSACRRVGGGDYGALLPDSISIELFGRTCHCASLATLIRLKVSVRSSHGRCEGRRRRPPPLTRLSAGVERVARLRGVPTRHRGPALSR